MSQQGEQSLNIPAIRAEARAEWEARVRKSLSVQERIGESVPWWLVLIAGVFFLLSVPHTVAIFNKITPMVGYVAPVGVEFGLLYAAFRRRQVPRMSPQLILLEVLLFFTAVVVNGAGSFEAVVSATREIQGMSFEQLLGQYRNLPATSQVALLLAPIAAIIIPIGTIVAGEGLATLLLERRVQGDLLEARWREDAVTVEFEALRDAALMSGMTPGRAVRWAEQVASVPRPQPSAATGSSAVPAADTDKYRTSAAVREASAPLDSGHGTGQGYSKNMSAREIARAYIEDNPDALNLSVRQFADAAGIGKTVAAEVMAEYRAGSFSSNGNGHEY